MILTLAYTLVKLNSHGRGRTFFNLCGICFITAKEVRLTEFIGTDELTAGGVEIFGDGVCVERGCVIEAGVKIYAPSFISAGTHLRRGACIMPFCNLTAAHVGENTIVLSSTLTEAHVGANCRVGPYAYLRGGATVGDDCRVGDFVEIKSSSLGRGTKAAHLAYIGDAEIGERVNIGCGAVFANYDGIAKSRTKVGDGCFIGCNCNIVAPVSIGAGAYVAAGTTVTCDLNGNDFCIGRAREVVRPNGSIGRYSGNMCGDRR